MARERVCFVYFRRYLRQIDVCVREREKETGTEKRESKREM